MLRIGVEYHKMIRVIRSMCAVGMALSGSGLGAPEFSQDVTVAGASLRPLSPRSKVDAAGRRVWKRPNWCGADAWSTGYSPMIGHAVRTALREVQLCFIEKSGHPAPEAAATVRNLQIADTVIDLGTWYGTSLASCRARRDCGWLWCDGRSCLLTCVPQLVGWSAACFWLWVCGCGSDPVPCAPVVRSFAVNGEERYFTTAKGRHSVGDACSNGGCEGRWKVTYAAVRVFKTTALVSATIAGWLHCTFSLCCGGGLCGCASCLLLSVLHGRYTAAQCLEEPGGAV